MAALTPGVPRTRLLAGLVSRGLLRLIGTGSNGGQLDFTGYGTPVTLTAPPASQTLDGAKYGF